MAEEISGRSFACDIADAVASLCSHDMRYVTGQIIYVDAACRRRSRHLSAGLAGRMSWHLRMQGMLIFALGVVAVMS